MFVIDLGSVHGTFVSNERLKKDIPVEIEPGQSLRFAASTRTYVLRKSSIAPPSVTPFALKSEEEIAAAVKQLPPPPHETDLEAVSQYNTMLNRMNLPASVTNLEIRSGDGDTRKRRREEDGVRRGGLKRQAVERGSHSGQRAERVRFRDEFGGILVEVVGFSDGYDVDTTTGPVGAKEGGSLIGQFDSLVQTVLIPKVKTKNAASAGRVDGSEGLNNEGATSSGIAKNSKPRIAPSARMPFLPSKGLYDDTGVGDGEKSSKKWALSEDA